MLNLTIKRTDLLYHIAFAVHLLVLLLSSTLISALYDLTIVRLASFFIVTCLLTIKLIIENDYKHLWIYFIILIVFLVVGLNATNIRDLIVLGYLTIEARNVNIKSIVKEYLLITSFVFICTVFFYYIGLFRNVDTTSIRGTGVIRRSLGFRWTTYSANYFLSIIMCIIFLEPKRKYKSITCLLLSLGAYCLFTLTDTRVAFYESIIIIILYSIIDIFHIRLTRFKLTRFIISSVFIICAAFSLWISLYYDSSNTMMAYINRLATYRLDLAHRALQMYGVSFWGKAIEWVTSDGYDYFYVDSSYIQLIIQYGIVIFLYVIVLFTLLTRYYLCRGNAVAVMILMMIAVHSITDPQLFNLAYNPFLLSFGMIIANQKETKTCELDISLNRRSRIRVI